MADSQWRPVTPRLACLSDVEIVRELAYDDTGVSDRESITALLTAIVSHEGAEVRAGAMNSLRLRLEQGHIHLAFDRDWLADSLKPAVLNALVDSDRRVQIASIMFIIAWCNYSSETKGDVSWVVPVLFRLLDDHDAQVVGAAVEAFWHVDAMELRKGVSLTDRVPALGYRGDITRQMLLSAFQSDDVLNSLKQKDSVLCQIAVLADACAGERSVDSIGRRLKDDDSAVRLAACRALGRTGSKALPSLLSVLDASQDVGCMECAIDVIGDAALSGCSAVEPLKLATAHTEPAIRARAAIALGGLGHGQQAVRVALRSMLGDPVPRVRAAAIQGLGRLGLEAREELPALLEATEDPDSHVRRQADALIGDLLDPDNAFNVEVGAAAVISKLMAEGDDDTKRRVAPFLTLGAVSVLTRTSDTSGTKRFVETIRLALQDPSTQVRQRALLAVLALGEVGNALFEVIAGLIGAASTQEHTGENVSREEARRALSAVSRIGAASDAVLDVMKRAIQSANAPLRWDAACEAARIDPHLDGLVPVLTEAVRLGDQDTRELAEKRLRSIGTPG